nr:hypothetical protein [Bradyrhizobium sp. CCBAU 11434]
MRSLALTVSGEPEARSPCRRSLEIFRGRRGDLTKHSLA